MKMQRITGQHRFAEFRVVDPHEKHDLRNIGDAGVVDADGARRLGQGLDDEDARHHGELREVTLEEILVDGDVLDADTGLVAIDVDDLVDEQEGVAMRQQLHDLLDVRSRQRPCLGLVVHQLHIPVLHGTLLITRLERTSRTAGRAAAPLSRRRRRMAWRRFPC